MSQLREEVRRWNTPTLGAYLLWCFTDSYSENHPTGDSPIGLLHFVALAILTNPELSGPISGRRDGIPSYVRQFEEKRRSDLLFSIHDRIRIRCEFSLNSIDMAIAEGLLVWDAKSGKLHARKIGPAARGKKVKLSIDRMGKKARILGMWFSQHDLGTIATYLKVAF